MASTLLLTHTSDHIYTAVCAPHDMSNYPYLKTQARNSTHEPFDFHMHHGDMRLFGWLLSGTAVPS